MINMILCPNLAQDTCVVCPTLVNSKDIQLTQMTAERSNKIHTKQKLGLITVWPESKSKIKNVQLIIKVVAHHCFCNLAQSLRYLQPS